MSWIVMDLFAAVAMALSVCFAKKGVEKTDPTIGAAIFCFAICAMELFIGRRKFSPTSLLSLNSGDWFDIVMVGILLGLSWQFIFMAFKSGDSSRVFTMAKLYILLIPVIEILINRAPFPRTVIFAMVFFVVGIIMLLVGSESTEWLFNSLIAASFYTVYQALEEKVVDQGSFAIFLSHVIALFMFLIISMVKRNGDTFKSLTFAHGVLLMVAGFCVKFSSLFYDKAVGFFGDGNKMFLVRINRFDIIIALGVAAVLFKEKLSAKKIVGVTFVLAAIEVLTI